MTFVDLGLSEEVLRAVGDAGYVEPTPIQSQAIPHVLMGRDILGCAQTGTGKTASFTLPMIDILASGRAKARMPRTLILEPTRELAAQVSQNFETYGKYHKLSMALLIGGVSFSEQETKLSRGVDVLIATPGRLLDHVGRGKVLLNDVKVLVIDEADRMLDMGFIPDVERIVGLLPRIRQTLFFSATMPPEIRRLGDKFLINPREISVAPPASVAETVEQLFLVVDERDKRDVLRKLIDIEDVKNALIFCNRKRDVDDLYRSLQRHKMSVAALHGDLSQSYRMETLAKFKAGEVTYLVASDVAARGLDIPSMSHVFNFDVPIHAEDYVHRIGRTGRAGRMGRAITLATPEDTKFLDAITRLIGSDIPQADFDGIAQLELGPIDARGGRRRGKPTGRARATSKPTRQRRGAGVPAPASDATPAKTTKSEASTPVAATQRDEESAAIPPAPTNGATSSPVAADTSVTADSAAPKRARRRPGGDSAAAAKPRGADSDKKAAFGLDEDVPAFLRRPTPERG